MNIREFFFINLPKRCTSQVDRAVLTISFLKKFESTPSISASELQQFFEEAHLAKPNPTILGRKLAADKRVSFRNGRAKALHLADSALKELFPEITNENPDPEKVTLDRKLLFGAPFIDSEYMCDLDSLADLYKALHVLENSIRRLIQAVLESRLGASWWDAAASASMKRKHEDRLQREKSRKWLPARSNLGPLYSVDWPDLISIMRKYESDFIVYIGEIEFLHRYSDMGLLRNVVSHHGFVDDSSHFQRVALALSDWSNQVAPNLKYLPET